MGYGVAAVSTPRITIDQCGALLEVTVWSNETGGSSVLVSAAEWVAVAAQAEQTGALRAYRTAEAKLAHSHGTRRA